VGLLREAIGPKMAGNETVRPAQVYVLQGTLCARRAESVPLALVCESELSPGTQGGVGPAVAGQAGEPRVLERARKCRPRAGVAEGASKLLEKAQEEGASLSAILDRLLHRSEAIVVKGRSYRMKGVVESCA